MPQAIWNVPFLTQNAQRRFPIAAETTVTDTSGAFVLPDDVIVSLDLPVHAGLSVDPSQFFILYIGAYATGYSIVIGYQPSDGGPAVPVASALIPRQVQAHNTTYALGGIAPFDDTVGKITIGRLDSIDLQPPGFWTFTLETTRLENDAIRPILRGVSSLAALNSGAQPSIRLYGDIEFQAGTNMQIVVILAAGQDPILQFNAIQGEGTVQECVCTGDSALTPPIQTINGVGPTPAGELNIVGTDCLQIVPIANGLQLIDKCAQPCCNCKDLETITRDLERLNAQAAMITAFESTLQNAIDTFQATVLGSKLNDSGCSACP